jgi:hypothetical protein
MSVQGVRPVFKVFVFKVFRMVWIRRDSGGSDNPAVRCRRARSAERTAPGRQQIVVTKAAAGSAIFV